MFKIFEGSEESVYDNRITDKIFLIKNKSFKEFLIKDFRNYWCTIDKYYYGFVSVGWKWVNDNHMFNEIVSIKPYQDMGYIHLYNRLDEIEGICIESDTHLLLPENSLITNFIKEFPT
jgi:hypothetical protein